MYICYVLPAGSYHPEVRQQGAFVRARHMQDALQPLQSGRADAVARRVTAEEIVDMGFERSKVERALEQCGGDFDSVLEQLTQLEMTNDTEGLAMSANKKNNNKKKNKGGGGGDGGAAEAEGGAEEAGTAWAASADGDAGGAEAEGAEGAGGREGRGGGDMSASKKMREKKKAPDARRKAEEARDDASDARREQPLPEGVTKGLHATVDSFVSPTSMNTPPPRSIEQGMDPNAWVGMVHSAYEVLPVSQRSELLRVMLCKDFAYAGMKVLLTGLTERPELNGRLAMVVGSPPAAAVVVRQLQEAGRLRAIPTWADLYRPSSAEDWELTVEIFGEQRTTQLRVPLENVRPNPNVTGDMMEGLNATVTAFVNDEQPARSIEEGMDSDEWLAFVDSAYEYLPALRSELLRAMLCKDFAYTGMKVLLTGLTERPELNGRLAMVVGSPPAMGVLQQTPAGASFRPSSAADWELTVEIFGEQRTTQLRVPLENVRPNPNPLPPTPTPKHRMQFVFTPGAALGFVYTLGVSEAEDSVTSTTSGLLGVEFFARSVPIVKGEAPCMLSTSPA